uniref:Uncharacterized protein C6orf203 n=1 Tax=Aceria tosichella TaxID=561515 RepID=A0A6G1SQE6_9ACAR
MTALCRNVRFLVRQHDKLFANHKLYCTPFAFGQAQYYKMPAQRVNHLVTVTNQTSSCANGLVRASPTIQINLEQRRFKRKRPSKQDEEAEEEEDEEDLSNENPLLMDDLLNQAEDGSEFMTINISSLRLDTFCKTAFSMTRARVEELFYKGDIYINGELPHKKSMDLNVGDEIDVVKSINPEDSKLVNVKRAVILKLPDKASEHGRMKLDIQRWQDLSVEARARKGNH